ncbi:MAG: glycosyltransferase family 2 protein, partial [Bacteroidota bacterium]|nr:glycosyltransferase family 2 protein [Bacteroidota bacterium]
AIMILDADNIMAPNVLSLMNGAINSGFSAVQGHRIAKNTDTPFARLDAISEEINNCIFRRGHRALGVSSALIGSGMAFDYELYKTYMATIDSYGEDKELEFKLLKDDIKIEFVDEALIYDEKVSVTKVFVRQRTRWLFNQILYAQKYFFEGIKLLFTKGNFDFFDKMFQQFLPPRILFIGLTSLLTLGSFFYNPINITYIWGGVFTATVAAFIVAVPKRFYNIKTLKAVCLLPMGFVLMFKSLIRLQDAKKGFGATTHTVNKIKNDKKK